MLSENPPARQTASVANFLKQWTVIGLAALTDESTPVPVRRGKSKPETSRLASNLELMKKSPEKENRKK